MANELTYDKGVSVTLDFELANPAAAATTVMLFGAQTGLGFVVPAGYGFHPVCLSGESNADLTAGTATYKVTSNGTVIAGGPEPILSDPVQRAVALKQPGASPVAAGNRVGVAIVTDAGYLPVTADHTAVLIGILLPV